MEDWAAIVCMPAVIIENSLKLKESRYVLNWCGHPPDRKFYLAIIICEGPKKLILDLTSGPLNGTELASCGQRPRALGLTGIGVTKAMTLCHSGELSMQFFFSQWVLI
jgi:hypothetical protein